MAIKYKIINTLGSGVSGTSFLVQDEFNKKYVLKQATLPVIISGKEKKKIKKVVKFSNDMYKINKNHFSKLHQHSIHTNCKIIKKIQKVTVFGNNANNFKKKQSSKNCVKYLFDFKECMFGDEKYNVNSFISQMTYIIYLMKNKNWTQNDFNFNNIVYNKTNLKTIKIKINKKEYEIKTFGKIYSLIDYDNVEKYYGKKPKDMLNFIYNISNFLTFFYISCFEAVYNLKIKNFEKKIIKEIKTNDIFLYYMENREKLRQIIIKITNNVIDPNKYLNNLINFKKYKKDILFMYKNMNDDVKIIKYFNNK
jgi:hypothetical protein